MRLFEFGDQDWSPEWYHVYMRRYLVFYYKLFGYFKLWIPAVSEFINGTGSRSYLECCAGSGQVLDLIVSTLPDSLVDDKNFIMTDISPLPEFVEHINTLPDSRIRYHAIPVDATQIPAELNYPRIFVNSFHHFPPKIARQIIQSSIRDGQGVLILEYVRHSILGYLSMLGGSLAILLTLPFVVKPRQLPLMALLTYVLPLFPLMFFWDGVVSCLRVYSRKDISGMLDEGNIPAVISSISKRSLLYPAGVSAISIIPAQAGSN